MEIFIETAAGGKTPIQAEATETIASILAKFIDESSYPVFARSFRRNFHLRGPELSEDRTLGYYGIKNGTVFLIFPLIDN